MSALVVWRLCARHREPSAFTGDGAARFGGRWNRSGTRVVYCAESRALAALEVLVHANDSASLGTIPWLALPTTIPAALVERPAKFPLTWREYPHSGDTQDFGSAWARELRSVALRVPSAVVPGEFNYLINPQHPDFSHVKVGPPEPFSFDPRLAV